MSGTSTLDIELSITYARVVDENGVSVSGAIPKEVAEARARRFTHAIAGRTYTTVPAEKPARIGAITRRKRGA